MDYLNLFINQLSIETRGKELNFMRPQLEEDRILSEHYTALATGFGGPNVDLRPEDSPDAINKVNVICNALRARLVELNE